MKTILALGIFGTLFMYVFVSMHNHTWDIMNYSQGSTYTFAVISGLCWAVGAMFEYLKPPK